MPLKRFPVLVDAGHTEVEATIVIEYLGLHHPGPVRLIPEDPRAAAPAQVAEYRRYHSVTAGIRRNDADDQARYCHHAACIRRTITKPHGTFEKSIVNDRD